MHLNYLPLRFTSDVFCGGLLKFEGDPKLLAGKESELSLKLRALRGKHNGTHVFHASGNSIACIQLKPDAAPIGEPTQFDIVSDFQLANALARAALFEFFRSSNETVTRFRPVTVLLEKHNLASRRKDVFGFIPEYTLDVRPLAPHEGEISSGVLITFGVRHIFLKTAAELVAEGVSLRGLYAVAVSEDGDIQTPLERRYLGRIEDVRGDIAILSDSDVAEFPLEKCFPEGSRFNVEAIGRALLGDDYDTFSTDLLDQTFEIMGATKQMDRLNKLGIWLESKSALPCAAGLSVRIQKSPHECRKGTDAGDADTFLTPSSVLRPGGTITVAWPVDNQIDTHGPYDAESFPDKRVKIAVICPEEFIGEAGQFLKQFKDGFPSADEKARFRQGFVRKYHLNSCDFSFHAVKRTSSSLEEAYKAASFEALKEKPNLAVAIIREQHRELPDAENPYYTTKARLMAQGVPVQLIEIETIRQSGRAFILNNLSVAMYAKLAAFRGH